MFFPCELSVLLLTLTLNSQVRAGEVIGGREAKPHSRPYMVLIELHMQDGKPHHCGGFLLNEDFVITAAHCQASSYTAFLGAHNIHNKHEIQSIPVTQAFPHKDYDPTDYSNDVMLLKLSSKANFNQNVKSITLADKTDGSLPKSCSFSGWGFTEWDGKHLSPVLMEVNLTLTDTEMCPKENSYCSKGESGPGRGDSGGPLVCEDGKAFGVMSCCMEMKAGDSRLCAFSKISDYSGWICSIMGSFHCHNM